MIKELTVKNFMSLKDVTIRMGQLNVLVGPNLSGKSNLLRSLRLLYQMVNPQPGAYGLPNAIHALGGVSEVSWKGTDSLGPIHIGLVGSGQPFSAFGSEAQWEYRIVVTANPAGAIWVQDESLSVQDGGRACSLIDSVAGDRRFATKDGRSISAVGSPDRSALEYEIPDWEGNALRNFFRSIQFHQLVPPVMQANNQSAAAAFLTECGNNLSSWLMTLQTKYGESFERMARVAQDAFPSLERLFTVPTQQGQVFLASQEKHLKRPVSIFHMAHGELAFIALLSLIFSPPELAAPFYCIEEPENNLHPRLLATLVEVLKQVQEEYPPEQRAQIVITTHSPYLIDRFSLDELIVFEKREGATVTARPRDKAHLQQLLDDEEIGLGELFYSGALSGE